jgi:hypothetical protein
MKNNNLEPKVGGINLSIREDGILKVTIGASLEEGDVERLINDAFNLSQKNPGKTRVLVNFTVAPHIPSFIFRKKIVGSVKKMLAEIKDWKVATYGGGVAQKAIASFITNAAGLDNIKFLKNEEDALKWLKEEN